MTNSIDRATAHAAQMYPQAEIKTRNHRGRPVVWAEDGKLIRLIRLTDLDAKLEAAEPGTFDSGA
jgi:hypothetical protein